MENRKVFVPPLKTQGIKTKLVPLIRDNVALNPDSVWVEPFMGSGVVGFNVAPRTALFSDTNPYIIQFYNEIKAKTITAPIVRQFLEEEGKKLEARDGEYYYEVRERFNQYHASLDFLFLNRSCFNGMIRFNKQFEFNVPYGHKPRRFSKAYITKIVNQVRQIEEMLCSYDWSFLCRPFETAIEEAPENAFFYCDPPYIGRNVDFYDSWSAEQELKLYTALVQKGLPFMLSTWDHNAFRVNEYVESLWGACFKIMQEHFYYVGAQEKNRNSVVEALLMNYAPKEEIAQTE